MHVFITRARYVSRYFSSWYDYANPLCAMPKLDRLQPWKLLVPKAPSAQRIGGGGYLPLSNMLAETVGQAGDSRKIG